MATEMARLSFASVSAGVVDMDAARRQQNLVHDEYTGENITAAVGIVRK